MKGERSRGTRAGKPRVGRSQRSGAGKSRLRGALSGFGVAAGFGLLPGVLVARLGGAGLTLLAAYVWSRRKARADDRPMEAHAI